MTNKCSKLYQKSRRYSSRLAYCHVSWDTLYLKWLYLKSKKVILLDQSFIFGQKLLYMWLVKFVYKILRLLFLNDYIIYSVIFYSPNVILTVWCQNKKKVLNCYNHIVKNGSQVVNLNLLILIIIKISVGDFKRFEVEKFF